MKKWEYKTYLCDAGHVTDTEAINRYGNSGWEVVSVNFVRRHLSHWCVYTLKRKIN